MERTKLKTLWRMGIFVLNHKIISALLAAILVVAAFGGVAFGSVSLSVEDATTENIDGSKLIPIQQGTTTKVNFLPAYNGDTPPCNFYKKDSNDKFSQITGITNMNCLANKIREIRPENVYTDGQDVTFYGTYDTKWRDAFLNNTIDHKETPQYCFKESFEAHLKEQDLAFTNVYRDSSLNWDTYKIDYKCWDTPKLGDVSYEDFYNAFKLGDSTYKGGDPNLLSSKAYRTWGSFFENPLIGSKYTYAYICENPGSSYDKWDSTSIDYDDSPFGAVVLTQKMSKYTVTFSGNGHETNLPSNQSILDRHKVNCPSTIPSVAGFDFGDWYMDSECVNVWNFKRNVVIGDTIIYAKWSSKPNPSNLIPIQQGTTTKVNFLPAYYDDTPPCNFYKKESNGTFTQIIGIYNMNSLANKIREIRPENVYTDGRGLTFYGTYNTKWKDAFGPDGGIGIRFRYEFLQSFKDNLKNQGLSFDHVYNKNQNWDARTTLDAPMLGCVNYDDFYKAYKLGDSTYKGGDPNLLSSEVYRTFSSRSQCPLIGYAYAQCYKCEEPVRYADSKWKNSYINHNPNTGAVVLAQIMSKYTVTFSGNGHGTSLPQAQTILYQHKAMTPSEIPTDPGFDFCGWYKDPECTTEWDFNKDVVTGNTILYAKWPPKPITSRLVPIQQGSSYKVNFLPAYNGDKPPCNFYKKESDGSYSLITGITNMASLAIKIREAGAANVYAEPKRITFYGFYDNTTWSNAFKHESDGEKHHRYEFMDSFKTELTNHGLPTTSVYTERAGSDYVNPGNWDYHNADTPTLNGISIHTFWSAYKNANINLLGTNSWRIWTSYENAWASDDAMEYWDSDGKMEWHANKGFENDKGTVILTKIF